jgi:hypothetical protein
MQLIKKERVDKKITKPFSLDFFLQEESLCLIEIIASAKPDNSHPFCLREKFLKKISRTYFYWSPN